MKKKDVLFTVLSVMLLAFILVGCKGLNPQTDSPNDIENVTEDAEELNEGQNEIEDMEEVFTSLEESISALKASITEEQENTTVPSEVSTNVVKVTEAGSYYYSGEVSSITVAKGLGVVHLYLDNVTIQATDDKAISAKAGTVVIITLIGENNLTTTGESAENAISVKDNLVINGSGTLNINTTKSALNSDKTIVLLGGTLNITAVKHCVTADSIYINGATINALYCGKDVLHAESDYDSVEEAPTFNYGLGFVYIETAVISTTQVYGDAIQADSFVYIKDGTYNLTTTPTWNDSYTATANQEKGMYNARTHEKVSRDSVRAGSTYAVLEESVKGIKVGEIDYYLATDTEEGNELVVESENYLILIQGGTFNISTVDDAIHANSGSVVISGGNLTIQTSDDGIHADKNLKITGSAVINVTNSYEGIEAETIEISGGDIKIFALDDGINATNSNLSESAQKNICQITISGGRVDVTVNPNGDRDGIDSNGGIKITGGVLITRGPNSQMASPIDAANAISISGGTVIVIGNAPGSNSRRGPGGSGGPGGFGGGEGTLTLSSNMVKTQSSSSGLSKGSHTVTIGSTVIEYTNAYSYSGYVTVYASESAQIK